MTHLGDLILEILEATIDKSDVQYYVFGKPFSISESVLAKGLIIVEPLSTDIVPVTTGITDEEVMGVNIILAKSIKDKFVQNAQIESGSHYLARIMEGRGPSGELLSNTIRYVIRNQQRTLGLRQEGMSIEYNSNELDNVPAGTVTATLALEQMDHYTQPLI